MNRQLKDFLYQNMYQHHRVVRMQVKAERVSWRIFQALQPRPESAQPGGPGAGHGGDLHRTVCDYIAGMTDRFALQEHGKLFDPGDPPEW